MLIELKRLIKEIHLNLKSFINLFNFINSVNFVFQSTAICHL